MKKLLFIITVISFISCDSKKGKTTWEDDDNDYSEETDYSTTENKSNNEDTFTLEDMSKVEKSINDLQSNINDVNSPDKLMEYGSEIEDKISMMENQISRSNDSNERDSLENQIYFLKKEYDEKQREYSMPANGLIQNINNLKKRLNECHSEKDFLDILNNRYSYFKNLPNLHKIVEEKNRQSEVREKASELSSIFSKKASEFYVEIK